MASLKQEIKGIGEENKLKQNQLNAANSEVTASHQEIAELNQKMERLKQEHTQSMKQQKKQLNTEIEGYKQVIDYIVDKFKTENKLDEDEMKINNQMDENVIKLIQDMITMKSSLSKSKKDAKCYKTLFYFLLVVIVAIIAGMIINGEGHDTIDCMKNLEELEQKRTLVINMERYNDKLESDKLILEKELDGVRNDLKENKKAYKSLNNEYDTAKASLKDMETQLGECNVEWDYCKLQQKQNEKLNQKQVDEINTHKTKFSECLDALKQAKIN